jgi:phage nucleotide-binding protein
VGKKMQVSHSRIECFNQCPFKYKLRYADKLKTLPDDKPDNALYLGTALHTGLEIGVEEAIQQYYNNYPIITDDHINEAMKLEVMIPKAKQMIPDGLNEVLIDDPDFKGFIDLLVPVGSEGGISYFDIYDFKYSNNKQNYLDSDQLHLYKFFYEKLNPLCSIRNMYFLMVPKSKCKQIKGEDLLSYRQRLLMDLKTLNPELVPIQYDPTKVIRFLLETKSMLEADTYKQRKGFMCRYCEFQAYCEKGEDYMLLPENKRRDLNATTKKVIWIYGSPFSGKTTFANQFPDPLMLNTDGNIKFVDAPYIHIKDEVKKVGRMTERKSAWQGFKEIIDELELKENTFETIVVDLLEDLYEHCRRDVCDQKGWDHESDDSFRAWDMVRTEFLSTMKRLMNLDYKNIVLISHLDTTKDITKKGGDKLTSIKPNINEKVANKIAGMVDIVARAIADDGQYVLSFKRNEVIFGGGRLKFKAAEIPLDYKAFCDLYTEANANLGVAPVKTENVAEVKETVSNTEKVPCEDTPETEVVDSTETDTNNVDNGSEPVRRRRRRTETE